MSPSPTAPTRPSLTQIAEVIHHAVADDPVARLAYVQFDPEQQLSLGFWDVPDDLEHPADPLVGFVAPQAWDAIGLICSGRMRSLDDPTGGGDRVLSTVLLDRTGDAASVLGCSDRPIQVFEEPPIGWVADVLARALRLPTPPPEQSTATLLELEWLDRVAAGVLHRPSRARSWAWLADRHPMRGRGPAPAPEILAARTAAESLAHPWSQLRTLGSGASLPAARSGPPGGSTLSASEWFDDGSLSRWMLRRLPPAEALLPDLLAVLAPDLGQALIAALVEVEPG